MTDIDISSYRSTYRSESILSFFIFPETSTIWQLKKY